MSKECQNMGVRPVGSEQYLGDVLLFCDNVLFLGSVHRLSESFNSNYVDCCAFGQQENYKIQLRQ